MSKETLCRTIIKTVGWRVIGAVTTFSIAYFVDNNIDSAIKISILDSTVNLTFYFLYERAFAKLKWGYVLEDEENEENDEDKDNENDNIDKKISYNI
tara:strand:+ start:108 stop:398 length:291 start_codon:yes stop_codon:yes gene_type:complete